MQLMPALAAAATAAAAVGAYAWLQRRIATPVERLGKVVYMGDDPRHRTLQAPGVGLRGRPDYVVRRGLLQGVLRVRYEPVEYKSAARPQSPRARDVAQLAAYGLLLQAHFRHYPQQGWLVYGDGPPMRVRLGRRTERSIRQLLGTMRGPDRYPARVPSDARCRACPVAARCPMVAV